LAQAGEAARAEKWLERMEEAGVQANITTFAAVVHTVSRSNDVPRLERLFARMSAAKVEASSTMYNAVISACAQRAEVSRAEEWLNKMCEAGAGADVASYSAVVHACAKANDVPRAESWVEKMQEAGIEPNIVTYNSVINACARTADADRAEYWLERMESRGVAPGALTFNSLINACAKANVLDRAEKWLSGMRERNVTPDVVSYSTVIHACTQAGAPARAEKWLEEMRSLEARLGASHHHSAKHPNSFCLNSVSQAFARIGNGPKAAKWLDFAVKERAEASAASFCGVVAAYVRGAQLDEAERWLMRMLQEGHAPPRSGGGSHEAVASAYAQRGDRERAAAVRKAFGEAQSHRGGHSNRQPYACNKAKFSTSTSGRSTAASTPNGSVGSASELVVERAPWRSRAVSEAQARVQA